MINFAGVAWLVFFVVEVVVTGETDQSFDAREYGVKADGKSDDSKAIGRAWEAACTSTTSRTTRVIIPKGNYMVGSLKFQGPCKSPVHVVIQGHLKASIDGRKLKNQDGWVVFQNIDALSVYGGGSFDGQASLPWPQYHRAKTRKCNSPPTNIRFNGLTNSKIQDVSSLNSKFFHINVFNCKNLTLERITIATPNGSPNTDGIHIGRSTGVNIISTDIKTGDDCVSLGDGSQQVKIERVTCGPGHGISVGSLGRYFDEQPVNGVTVKNCTLTNTTFGVRIKTLPASPSGLASNLHFDGINMNNVSTPLLIDQTYCPYGRCQEHVPSRVRLSDISFKNIHGTSATQVAMRLVCSKGFPCKNVGLHDINLQYTGKEGFAISECANVKPKLSGRLVPAACAKAA